MDPWKKKYEGIPAKKKIPSEDFVLGLPKRIYEIILGDVSDVIQSRTILNEILEKILKKFSKTYLKEGLGKILRDSLKEYFEECLKVLMNELLAWYFRLSIVQFLN